MPQLAPMNWLGLFIFFNLLLSLIQIKTYYLFFYFLGQKKLFSFKPLYYLYSL